MATTFDRLLGFADNITNAKQVDVATASEQKKSALGNQPLFGFPEPTKGTLAYQQGEDAIKLAEQDARNPMTRQQMEQMQGNQLPVQNTSILPENTAYMLQAGRVGNVGMDAFDKGTVASDFMQLPAHEILAKYGNKQGMEIINARANAADQVFLDKTRQRGYGEAATDTAIDIGSGLVGSLGGVGALGLGLVNDNAGAFASEQLQDLTNWFHEGQSDALNARRNVTGAQQALTSLENKREFNEAVKQGNNKTIASLSRIGKDIADSIGVASSDPLTFQSGIAEAGGSLLAAGPLTKGLKLAGGALIPATTAKGVQAAAAIDAATGTQSLARLATTAAQHAPTMAAIGLMEGGGAYQQVVNEVLNTDFEQLAKTSPLYQEKIKAGYTPEQARIETASETGLQAAAIQASIAAATGALVSKFEANPFAKFTPKQAVSNMIKEAFEEGIQSGSGQVAQNLAVQQKVDPSKDLAEGVGEQIGTGALYGSLSAGVTQAPQATKALVKSTARTTLAGVGKVTSGIKDSVVARAEAVRERNEKASPISDSVMQQASQEMQATAEQDTATVKSAIDESNLSPEVKEQANSYADELFAATRFDPQILNQEEVTPLVREAVSKATDKVSAIQNLADVVNTADVQSDPEGYMDAAVHLYDMLSEFDSIANRDPEAFDSIPDNHPAREVVDKYMGLAANISGSPKVVRAIQTIAKMMQQQQAAPITEETIDTPEGKQSVQQTVLAAEVAPTTVDPKSADIILYHAGSGRIQLSERQRAALQSAAALVRGAKEYDSKAEELGLRPQDIVSKQIKTDDSRLGEGQYSALQHAQRIRSAYNAGNLKAATAYLTDFMKFAQHMQNKVGALNEHLATGNGDKDKSVFYDALTQSREWKRSRTGLGVDPRKVKSVQFAQQVALEASTVTGIANALASAFPELKVGHIETVPLDPRLNKPAREVVKDFRQPIAEPVSQVKETEPVVEDKPAQTVEEKEPVKETEPTPKAESTEQTLDVQTTEENQAVPTKSSGYIRKGKNVKYGDTITLEKVGDTLVVTSDDVTYRQRKVEVVPNLGIFDENGYVLNSDGDFVKPMSIARNVTSRTPSESIAYVGPVEEMQHIQKLAADRIFADLTGNTEESNRLSEEILDITSGLSAIKKALQQKSDTEDSSKAIGNEPKRTGIDSVYPALIGSIDRTAEGIKNFFKLSFTLPEEPTSRITGQENPLKDISNALRSRPAFADYLGKEISNAFDGEVLNRYRDLLADGSLIKEKLNERLQAFLDNKGIGQKLENGVEVNRWINGKILNIAEKQGDKYVLNDSLVESAILAALQWRLTATNNAGVKDEKDAARITGVEEYLLPDGIVDMLNASMTAVEATSSLAQKIEKYWGLKHSPDSYLGYTKGIPTAIAAELLDVLVEIGYVESDKLSIPNDIGDIKDINLYQIPTINKEDPILGYPSAIEEAVLLEPEDKLFLNGELPPVARSQLRNPAVENTPEQRAALKNEQATPFYLHTPMVQFYEAMGKEGILELMGAGTIDENKLNKNHAKSLVGRNLSISAAYDQFVSLLAQVRAIDEDITKTPIRYAYNMSRVGRMQMLGKYNPQSSKLMREAVLPTQSTLDLSNENSEEFTWFNIGLAQALGIKVHNMSREASAKKLYEALNGSMKPAVDALREFQSTGVLPTGISNTLKTSLGDDKSFVAIQALMEYARYLNATPEERKVFNTPLYVEADGVTNGPINAMQLMTGGRFTLSWVQNIAKGGLFFDGRTMNEHRSLYDSVDLYEASSNVLKTELAGLKSALTNQPELSNQMDHLVSLMDLFLPDLSLSEDGTLHLKRGIAKNPLTITVYGSGARGIAGKIVSILADAIYERMSDVMQSKKSSTAMAMFGKQAASEEHANEMLERFLNGMNALTSLAVVKRKDNLTLESTGSGHAVNTSDINPQQYSLSKEQLKALQDNMLHLFVNPLKEGINKTIGQPLINSTEMLQKATQIQSVVLQDLFNQAVEAKLKEKESDPTWKKGDFLTDKELRDIQKSLDKYAPFIKTGEQTFYIAGSESTEIGKGQNVARSMNERVRIPLMVYGPSQAGVAGIPFMTIGPGDGMMMQELATMKDAPVGTIKIFDGMHMKLTTIEEDSVKANKAVYRSWQGNPIKNVWESFSEFMKVVDFDKLSSDAQAAITKTLSPIDHYQGRVLTPAALKEGSTRIENALRNNAASIDVRHKVLDKVKLTIDQMAAVGKPYQTDGIDLSNLTQEELVAKLNEMYEQEIADRKQKVLGEGKAVLGINDIAGSINKMPNHLRQVVSEVLASKSVNDYKIVIDSNSPSVGQTEPSKKTITLASDAYDVMAHELVHAATFETVLSYYNGDSIDPTVASAIKRIEQQMSHWVSQDSTDLPSDATIRSYANTAENTGTASDKAIALNEFMAYVLTNKKLVDKAKSTTSLVRIAKNTIKLIKRMFSAMGFKAIAKDDVFSNLLFDTAIVMRGQPTTQQVAQDTVLFHNAAYGNNDRLTELNKTFSQLITQYLNTTPVEKFERRSKLNQELINTSTLVRMVQGRGFPMTMQESTTFQAIVNTLATAAYVDPSALSRAQELYSHVTKNITVEHFMNDPEGNDPADRYYAQEKFDVLMGNYGTTTDSYGRSSLLPVFLGLAMVNGDLRSVLKKIEPPKADKKLGNDLDDLLGNAGKWSMQKLNSYLAGDHKAANVQEALDALVNTVAEVSQRQQSLYDSVATPTGRWVDRANDYIVQSVEKLSDAAIEKADAIRASNANKVVKAGAEFTRLLSAIATEKNGQIVANGVMHAMNQGKVWQPFHDLVNDIVGRTDTNANVYDLIKAVRSQVQQDRQQFREHLPSVIADKFSRKLSEEEWSSLHMGMGKTDLAVLRDTMSMDEISNVLSDKKELNSTVSNLESVLKNSDKKNWPLVQEKAEQLAAFMTGGLAGHHLLRNAEAIANLVGIGKPSNIDVAQLDKLITLYALQVMPESAKVDMANLVTTEREGIEFSMAYMMGQRVDEKRKAQLNSAARFNAYKGYIPVENQQGVSLIVADDTEYTRLIQQSYVKVATYNGSKFDRSRKARSYYFSPVAARSPFSQGIMQNVRESVNGVDASSGFTIGSNVVGRITDPVTVGRIQRAMANRTDTSREPLMPVFNANGDVIAYELAAAPYQLGRLNQDTHFAKMVGIWRGRQVEEAKAQQFNNTLVDELAKMYSNDIKDSSSNKSQYVNILDEHELKKDPVLGDAVKLINPETLAHIKEKFDEGEFWVRRDMLNDAFGYRVASIGDVWTGTTRLSKETTDTLQRVLIGAMGNKAYRVLVNAENTIKHVVSDAKTLIVIKSLVVPAVNFLANLYQMVGRGVPVKDIGKGVVHKTNEINQYVKSRVRQIDAEAELRAAVGNPNLERKLKAEIQSIKDSHKRLSIWPLLEAGEFSSISDAGISRDDVLIPDGKMYEYMTKMVSKLPEPVRNAGRYALITKDTALFQGIQKTVEYSDFVAKAIIYDDLTKRKGKTSKEALGRVTEEFVNYDRLPGRFRSYMESMGLMWFYNFKIRSVKVAMSMIRNNPLHSLISTLVPAPTMFGNVGLPIEDNMFSALVDGRLDSSIGIGQGLRAPSLNPWHNLID